MASLSRDNKSGNYYVQFWLGERHLNKSLKTKGEDEATDRFSRIKETLTDIERGRLIIPVGADPWHFIKTDGRQEQKPGKVQIATLDDLFRWYEDQRTPGAKVEKTHKTEAIHQRHFIRILGKKANLLILTTAHVQTYINTRAKEHYKSRTSTIKARTIRKETDTLRMVWGRAWSQGQSPCAPPSKKGLTYPKGKEKPPFQTWDQIEQIIARGGLSNEDIKELWGSLFLHLNQIAELLEFVRTKKTRVAYLLPLMVFLAHTGARKSEAMRSQVEDFNFEERRVLIREKKKSQTQETFRIVPMSQLLHDVMQNYFKTAHPGGIFTICRASNEAMLETTLTEAVDWFFAASKWKVLKGYHVLRHSFASNLALKGVDQRVIDELMGHESEEMRRRYRHLFPEQRQDAIDRLFGN